MTHVCLRHESWASYRASLDGVTLKAEALILDVDTVGREGGQSI